MTKKSYLMLLSLVFSMLLSAPGTPAADQQTMLLIHSNATDGSTVFTDSSPKSRAIAAVGNVKHSTAQTLFGKTSVYFDGTGDYLQLADSDDWYLDQGDWTIDFWMRPDDGTARGIFGQSVNPGSNPLFYLSTSSTGQLAYNHYWIYYYTVTENVSASCCTSISSCPPNNAINPVQNGECGRDLCCNRWSYKYPVQVQKSITYNENFTTANAIITAGQWQHIAIVRQGNTITLYRNGTSVGSKAVAVNYNQAAPLLIGRDGKNSDFKGYMTEFRISKGIARWTADFTSPTGAYDGSTVVFTSGASSIIVGQSATLSWSTTNATTCRIEPGIGNVALNGSVAVSPTDSTSYTITADGSAGVAGKQVTVQVIYPPPTASIGANPVTIFPGQPTTLTWTSQYAKSAGINPGVGAVAVNGTITVTPGSTTNYTLNVAGPGGTATASVMVGQFVDSDNDQLPDDWEMSYFGNLNQGPNDDYDGDLFTNAMEFAKGTDPSQYNAEDVTLAGLLTNGQYFSGSKIIVKNVTIPINVNVLLKANCTIHIRPELHIKKGAIFRIIKPGDCDWLPDEWEMQWFGTLVYGNNDDPDGDGLTNYQEFLIKSDPTVFDTDNDNDGLNDAWELIYFGHLRYSWDDDPDNDEFINFLEMVGGSDPNSAESKPKPGTYYQYDFLGRIKKIYKVK